MGEGLLLDRIGSQCIGEILCVRVRRPGCLSIAGERANPSRIMAYAEADPEADVQNVIFYPSMFFQSKMLPKNAKIVRGKKEQKNKQKTAINKILLFWSIDALYFLIHPFNQITLF